MISDNELPWIVQKYRHASRIGDPPPFPQNVEDCQELYDWYGEDVKHLLPPRRDWKKLGITPAAEPFNPDWRRRFIATIEADRDFAEAMRVLIGGAS